VSAPADEPVSIARASFDASAQPTQALGDAGDEAADQRAESDPERFRCGRTSCRARLESCCSDGHGGGCVPTLPPGPQDNVQLLASQLQECGSVKLEYSLNEIARCDESADCGKNEACCGMFLFGGASANLCVPYDSPDTSPCDFSELCYVGKPCATRGAACVDGECLKPVTNLPCGSATCSGDASACCGDPPACRKPAECGHAGLRCARPSDCLKGQHCALGPMGTHCTGMLDLANTRIVCQKDADCPRQNFMCKAMRCAPSEFAGVKACACP
jgi:hypothetical protein